MAIAWTTVKNFGKVKYFNISYFVLLIVPILAELYQRASSASCTFAKTIAFPATLRWLYAASLFYALAIAIYQYFCPSIIKTYEDVQQYIEKNHEMFLRSHPQHRLSIVQTHLDSDVDSELESTIQDLIEKRDSTVGEERTKIEQEINTIIQKVHPDAIQRFLTKDWAIKNVQSAFALWASFALYVLGTFILVVLLIIRSLHVFTF